MTTNAIKDIAYEISEIYRRLSNVSDTVCALDMLNSIENRELPQYALNAPAEYLGALCAELEQQSELLYKAIEEEERDEWQV